MPSFDDSSTSQRVNRILDAARASAVSAVSAGSSGADPEPDDVWPEVWPPGSDDDPPLNTASQHGRHPGGPAGPRWDVPGRAAIAGGAFAVLAIAVVILLQLRGPSPGTVIPGQPAGQGPETASAGSTGSTLSTGSVPSNGSAQNGSGWSGGVTPVGAASPQPLNANGSPLPGAPLPGGSAVSTAPTAGLLRVYVVGQVTQPGVVSLVPGARVEDAVNAAGGATAKADLAVMNLARKVVDGERIVVPRPGEVVPTDEPAPSAAPAPGSGDGASGSAPAGGAAPGTPVNLNTATVADLDALPGVGPVIASRIVDWRQQNGNFKTVDDLGEVSGIGDATLAKLRPLVRV